MIYELKCKLCGKKIGEWDVPENKIPADGILNDEVLGIADNCCTDCEKEHGSFKEMSEVFTQHVEDNYAKAKEFIYQSGRKIGAFAEGLMLEHPDKILYSNFENAPKMKEMVGKIEKDWKIDGLEHSKKVEAITEARGKFNLKELSKTELATKIGQIAETKK